MKSGATTAEEVMALSQTRPAITSDRNRSSGARHASRSRQRTTRALKRSLLASATALVVGVSHALRAAPPSMRYLPADALTSVVGRIWPRMRVVRRNYARVLDLTGDDGRVHSIARTSVRNFGRMAVDFLASCTMNPEEIWRWVTPTAEPYFKEAIAAGRGVIFAMPHMGSWDVAAAYAPAYGFPVTAVIENNLLAQIVDGARANRQQGVRLVSLDQSMRALFIALKRNEGVVLLSDIIPGSVQATRVPFFGRLAAFPTGPARLAVRTGAPIVIISAVRLADGRYVIEGLPPLWPDQRSAENDAIDQLTADLASGFAQMIARYPEQWYPFHAIWEGEGDLA